MKELVLAVEPVQLRQRICGKLQVLVTPEADANDTGLCEGEPDVEVDTDPVTETLTDELTEPLTEPLTEGETETDPETDAASMFAKVAKNKAITTKALKDIFKVPDV